MKRMMPVILMTITAVLFAAGNDAEKNNDARMAPRLLNYQGFLTDTLGNPITDPSVSMTFSIYDAVSAGSQKWTETQGSVGVDKGIFHILLGGVNPIPDSVFNAGIDRWLEMSIGGQALSPRTRIVSVPFAYTATYSDTAVYARNTIPDNDWNYLVSDGADTTLQMGGRWGLARAGNTMYGNCDSTHVNLGIGCVTGANGQNYKYNTVGGGYNNTAVMSYSTVGGGVQNVSSGQCANVSGGSTNIASAECATVAGGNVNTAGNYNATVSGGQGNIASGYISTVGGGKVNRARGAYSVVSGGGGPNEVDSNSAIGDRSAIGGGFANLTSGFAGTVGGGYWNYATNQYSTIAGGRLNTASGVFATVGGGHFNKARGNLSVIAGGGGNVEADSNSAIGDYSAIGGGYHNIARGIVGVIGGGYNNQAGDAVEDTCAAVYGGKNNSANAKYSFVGGGQNNTASFYHATVAGGMQNFANREYTFIGGGYSNEIATAFATIGGGYNNTVLGMYAVIGGGQNNNANTYWATIGGGGENTASGVYTTVAGGRYNIASDSFNTIGGGYLNRTAGKYSAILGGYADTITATGTYSYLFGINSNLTQDSTFMVDMPHVWFGTEANGYEFPYGRGTDGQALVTNGSGQVSWTSTNDNDWVINGSNMYSAVSGNVGIGVAAPAAKLDVAGTAQMTGFIMATGAVNGYILTSDASGVGTWQDLPAAPVTSVFGRTGAVAAASGDYTTTLVTEGTNLYFTDARAQAAITGGASSIVTSNLTANRALLSDGSGKVAVSAATNTELGYLSGVTSAIQTQLSGKQAVITGGASSITSNNLTANRALLSDGSGKVAISTATNTELGYLSGVTSAIQTQLSGKAPTASPTFTGNVTMPGTGIWNSSGNVGIGVASPLAKLDVAGSVKIADGTQAAGRVFTSDASGNGSWLAIPNDNDWTLRITDTADTTLQMGGRWGITKAGNTLYGTADSTHVNLGYSSVTGRTGEDNRFCTVSGGAFNTASRDRATVGGGWYNTAGNYEATVSGGSNNNAGGNQSTISGGAYNVATDDGGTIGGGYGNTAASGTGFYSVVGGGQFNAAGGYEATIGGGEHNTASGNFYATVGGGYYNTASGDRSTVAGGVENQAAGDYSAILGGYADTIAATGDYSYLFGINSNLTQDSTFMVDLPHIRFGKESGGYEFPTADGSSGQALITNGSGQVSWGAPATHATYTPTGSADANGNVGDIAWDDGYVYVKTSAGWMRAVLSSW